MYRVKDEPAEEQEPIETIHVYVVREGQPRPSLFPVILSIFALLLLIALGIFIPYQKPEQHALIRVPAILLPLKTFNTSVSVIPTGIKTYPATQAHGVLTIANGSILSEELPKGMIFVGKNGAEVVTDQEVYVPLGSATGLGYATVTAHVALPGAAGNISPLDIDSVDGTSLFIRNLAAFSGGADSYSVQFITSQDRETALTKARSILLPLTMSGLLESPCKESVTGSQVLHVHWTCQYVSYRVPNLSGLKVLSVQLKGRVIILEVIFVAHPKLYPIK